MELLDRYLQAVRFWLPRAQQQDIIAELSSDLHSQIEDKETELGRPLNDAELEAILKRCGSPILVASRYRPQTQLIGPALFPIYLFVLKVVLLWILVPVFLVIVGPFMILPAAHRGGALLETLSTLWSALFTAAGTITLVFAGLERTQAKFHLFEKWDVRSLPPVAKKSQAPSRTQSVFELIFGVIGLLWLLAIPQYPFLILGPAAAFLKPAPMWHSFYLLMVVLSVLGLVRQCLSLMRPQWAWFTPLARLIGTGLSMVVLYSILSVAFQTSSGPWQPYVIVDAATKGAQYVRLTVAVNAMVLVSLAAVWIGLSIAGIVQAWQFLQYLYRRNDSAGNPALLRFL